MQLSDYRKEISKIAAGVDPLLNGYPTIPAVVHAPAVVVAPAAKPTARFDVTMGLGTARWYFDVMVLTPFNEMDSGQELLDSYIDPNSSSSITAALMENHTLGGTVDDSRVIEISNYGGKFENANVQHIGAIINFEVFPAC